MKIYSKILVITFPLIVIPAVVVSLVAFRVSQSAVQSMAQNTLIYQLAKAIDIYTEQSINLQSLGEPSTQDVQAAQTAAADALRAVSFGDTGYILVVDATGFVISHPIQHYIRQNISGESWFYDIYNKDRGSFTFTWEGKKRLAQFQRISEWGWFVISNETESELLGPVERLGVYISGLLVVSLLIAFLAILFLTRRLTTPIQALLAGVERIRRGELAGRIGVTTNDEIGILAGAFNGMTDQLRDVIGSLEQRISERTYDLEQRALQLQTASEVAREVVSTHELDTLLNRSVNLILERFNFYHVNIFFVDEPGQFAMLRAGAGETGKQLMEHGFRVRIGEFGIISHVVKTGESRMVNDVKSDFTYIKHPLLSDAASEAALPLKVNNRVIGILDVQSQRLNDFTQNNVDVLQTLADQLAVAIENARLLDELRNSLKETRSLYQNYTQESWSRATQGRKISGYQFDLSRITPYNLDLPDEIRTRLLEGRAIPVPGNQSVLIAPLLMYDQLIGVLGVENENSDHQWSSEEIALLEAISNQVSLTLDNARLVEVTQNRAARDRMVAEITNKMRRAVDMDTLIQTAVREITNAISVPEVFIQLGVPPAAEVKGDKDRLGTAADKSSDQEKAEKGTVQETPHEQ